MSPTHYTNNRDPRPVTINEESKIPLSIFVSGIGGAIVTTITATALWCHMDAVLQTKASVGQLQGAFVQLQKDNPQLKVTIPGIRQDADYNDGGTLTGGTTNFLFARRQTPL